MRRAEILDDHINERRRRRRLRLLGFISTFDISGRHLSRSRLVSINLFDDGPAMRSAFVRWAVKAGMAAMIVTILRDRLELRDETTQIELDSLVVRD